MITSDILLFIVFAVASVGVGNLYLFLIRDGQLFGYMQQILQEFKDNKFIYKSIGGCGLCTRQRFTDLIYILFLFQSETEWYWYSAMIGYVLFSGVSFYFDFATKGGHVETKREKLDI